MGGLIYFLVQGPTGLERGQTNAHQIFYAIFAPGSPSIELALNHTPTNGSWTTSISNSVSPQELYVESTGYNDGTRLVAAP